MKTTLASTPRATALLVGAVIVGATVPGAAAAASPWSEPVPIGGPAAPRLAPTWVEQGATVPHVSAGTSGAQLATWPTTSPVEGRGAQVIAALDGGRILRVRTSTSVVDSARYGRDRILHLVAQRRGTKVQLGYRLGSADLSSLGSVRPFGGPRAVTRLPVMAVNASGAAVVAWHHATSRRDEVQLVTRPAGGRFGRIQTVATAKVDDRAPVAVGIDAGGRAGIAYALQSPGQVATRVIATDTGKVSSASKATAPVTADAATPLQLAVGASRSDDDAPLVVAWDQYRPTEDASPVSVTAGTIAPGSSRLTGVQTLDAGATPGYPRGPVLATVDGQGRAVVAWSALPPAAGGSTPASLRVPTIPLVAQAGDDGRFAAPQAIDTVGTIGSIATSGTGVQVGYLQESSDGSPLAEAVALRGAEPPFAAGEPVRSQPSVGPTDPNAYAAGLQPPGLTAGPGGELTAVFTNVSPTDAAQSTTEVARRPAP